MGKTTIRVLSFLIALFVGSVISFVWNISSLSSIGETNDSLVKKPSESIPIKDNEKAPPKAFEPCIDKNPLTYPSPEWKSKLMISGGFVHQKAICGNLPEYPQAAKAKNISGVVTVVILIDEIGEVKYASAKTGNSLFHKSAVEAAYKTRFIPTLLGGKSFKVSGMLMYKFDIEKGTWLQNPSASDNSFKKAT